MNAQTNIIWKRENGGTAQTNLLWKGKSSRAAQTKRPCLFPDEESKLNFRNWPFFPLVRKRSFDGDGHDTWKVDPPVWNQKDFLRLHLNTWRLAYCWEQEESDRGWPAEERERYANALETRFIRSLVD